MGRTTLASTWTTDNTVKAFFTRTPKRGTQAAGKWTCGMGVDMKLGSMEILIMGIFVKIKNTGKVRLHGRMAVSMKVCFVIMI